MLAIIFAFKPHYNPYIAGVINPILHFKLKS